MKKEIKITRNELKKISSEFRMVASRLLRTTFEEGMKNLKRFMIFIDNDLIIKDFIQKHNSQYFDIESIASNGLDLGITHSIPDNSQEDEISFTYQLLKYGLQNHYQEHRGYVNLAYSLYGNSGKIQDAVYVFNFSIIKPFVNYIENYLTYLQNDIGDDESAKITIQVYGDNYGNNLGATRMETNINQSNSSIGIGVNQGEISTENLAGTIYTSEKRSLAEAAAEIQQLLEQLDGSYPNKTTFDKMTMAAEAIRRIDSDSTLTQRILGALKAGGTQALEQLLNHPAASFVIGALDDWQKSKGS